MSATLMMLKSLIGFTFDRSWSFNFNQINITLK